jgi:hypothetical protein
MCFHSRHPAPLHADYFTGSISEVGLRVGPSTDYFGVIKVGEGKKLWDLIEADSSGMDDRTLVANEREFGVSLFDGIKDPRSKTRILIGAKMFTEGWSCWRVSAMGLINVGRNEGSQIIQLFGRGVRLKGKGFGLKRSNALHDHDHPEHLIELETLNVFGIRADYMDTFREYIEEEGVVKESSKEVIALPTIQNLARTDLKVILPKKNKPEFKRSQTLSLSANGVRGKVTADWYGRISHLNADGAGDSGNGGKPVLQPQQFPPRNIRFLDIDAVYLAALRYKRKNGYSNLEIDRDHIRQLLQATDWYELYLPPDVLEFQGFRNVKLWQEIATDLVLKYIKKFYLYHRDQHDAPYQEYRTLKQILDDDEESTNAQFLRNLRVEYLASIDRSEKQLVDDLNVIQGQLKNEEFSSYNAHHVEVFRFANHLYHPLIHIKKGELRVSVKPVALNEHERQFCKDLEEWMVRESTGVLEGKELYLLRNQSRGKGISFFEEGNFYPDFICWVVDGDHQQILFLDPHGLGRAHGFNYPKIHFHKTIKKIERERLKDPKVTLDSWILSPTHRNDLTWTDAPGPKAFLDHHVVFMKDDPEAYCGQIFQV